MQQIAGRTVDERAEVGLLTRNIRIQGAGTGVIDGVPVSTDGIGGHIMILAGAKAAVQGVELANMGQRGKLGHYPIHWHLAGAVPQQFIRNSSIWRSNNRCVTVHGTRQLEVRDNVCYDHLGHGETGGFARKDEEGKVHPGADDNASGTAALLELAGAFAEEATRKSSGVRRGIVFAAWSGEEVGLIGSSHFAERPPLPLSNVVAYVNFDMVGRLRDNKLNLQGIGSSPAWRKLIEKRNVAAGFNLTLQDDPYLPSDTTPFYPKNVPVIAFFTGSHEEYHRPADKPDTLNYEGLERIAKFARALVTDLVTGAERPAYAKVEKKDGGGGREQLRAYLGTIPDYAQEVAGVKISGTRGGSPAEKAGLKGGDIIVEFAGQKIANIYDYTYAMDAVKIGQPVKVIVLRDGKRVELTATPEVRK